ncbi:MAG: phosphoglycolate phosphatase [Pirellula sp.]|nr:phosphoglycolate phosphatase [Pirellula sp.]
MRYRALATDYDGTIATHGVVDPATVAALERWRSAGRTLIMVTGREMADLKLTCPRLDLFELIVAENGAELFRPSDGQSTLLGEAPPPEFVDELRRRGVDRISVGGCIVATWEPHEGTVLAVIRDLGLELHVIFNKGAVMILPAAVNKATGLAAALERLGLSPHEVVGVGDAENDHAFLNTCEFSAAVANALPSLKDRADLVLANDHGAGVAELIDHILADDLSDFAGRALRHQFLLGTTRSGADTLRNGKPAAAAQVAVAKSVAAPHELRLSPFDNGVLIAGPKGSGKSNIAAGLAERLGDHGYQHCTIDPEGDFALSAGASLFGGTVLGKSDAPPSLDEALQVLKNPKSNLVVNLSGLPPAERPKLFHALLARLLEMRIATGRPHWILVDEAQTLFPRDWTPDALKLAQPFDPALLDRLLLAADRPAEVAPAVLAKMQTVVTVGPDPRAVLREFTELTGDAAPEPVPHGAPSNGAPSDGAPFHLRHGEVLVYQRGAKAAQAVRPTPTRSDRARHLRRSLEGRLPPDDTFVFRGPAGKLKLRAPNLDIFLLMAEGVDPETWQYHLQQHDISRWFAESLQDDDLAAAVESIESSGSSPEESLQQVQALIEKRYRAPTKVAPAAAAH